MSNLNLWRVKYEMQACEGARGEFCDYVVTADRSLESVLDGLLIGIQSGGASCKLGVFNGILEATWLGQIANKTPEIVHRSNWQGLGVWCPRCQRPVGCPHCKMEFTCTF